MNDTICGYETNMFWGTNTGTPRRTRIPCASMRRDSKHHMSDPWSSDKAYTETELSAMVADMLACERSGERAWMSTCWLVEERYAHIVAPIAHLRTSPIAYQVEER